MRFVVDIFKNTTEFYKSKLCSKPVFELWREGVGSCMTCIPCCCTKART